MVLKAFERFISFVPPYPIPFNNSFTFFNKRQKYVLGTETLSIEKSVNVKTCLLVFFACALVIFETFGRTHTGL